MIRNLFKAKSRNPIYFGIFLFWAGVCITFPHLLLWACAFVCWICIEVIVRQIEEPYLKKVHGDEHPDVASGLNNLASLLDDQVSLSGKMCARSSSKTDVGC